MKASTAAVLLLVASIAPAPAAGASLYARSKVIELTVNNVQNYTINVSRGSVTVVEAYVSWCPHCQRMAPAYRRFAAEALPWAPAINVAAIDCLAHDILCRDLGVWGYPTLFIFGDVRESAQAAGTGSSRIVHEGAFAEGHPAHAIHELWRWVLSYARPHTNRTHTAEEVITVKDESRRANVPCVLYVRSPWEPGQSTGVNPPPPLMPLPATPPPMSSPVPAVPAPTPPPTPPEDRLSQLFDAWDEGTVADDDPCSKLTQPECLSAQYNCQPVIDCWNAYWPSSCRWWHEEDGWEYDVLRKAGCPCRCRSPPPPPPPSSPPLPFHPPPGPPSPPSPPLVASVLPDAVPRVEQAHILTQLAYELQPMRFAEWLGPPTVNLYERFGLQGNTLDERMPAVLVAPADGTAVQMYPFQTTTYEGLAQWLAGFQGSRRRGGMPTLRPAWDTEADDGGSGALVEAGLASPDSPPVWPVPASELRILVFLTLDSFVFTARECLEPTAHADLLNWIETVAAHLSFSDGDTDLLCELGAAVRRRPLGQLCFRDWPGLLMGLRASGFGAPHNLGNHSSACARSPHALTCTLWVAFHSIVAHASDEEALPALHAIRGFIRSFFGCHGCVRHFELMASHMNVSLGASPSKADVAVWLWRAHNTVNVRLNLTDVALLSARESAALAGGAGGDARGGREGGRAGLVTRHWLFPPQADCGECYSADEGARGFFTHSLSASCLGVDGFESPCDDSAAQRVLFNKIAVAHFLERKYTRRKDTREPDVPKLIQVPGDSGSNAGADARPPAGLQPAYEEHNSLTGPEGTTEAGEGGRDIGPDAATSSGTVPAIATGAGTGGSGGSGESGGAGLTWLGASTVGTCSRAGSRPAGSGGTGAGSAGDSGTQPPADGRDSWTPGGDAVSDHTDTVLYNDPRTQQRGAPIYSPYGSATRGSAHRPTPPPPDRADESPVGVVIFLAVVMGSAVAISLLLRRRLRRNPQKAWMLSPRAEHFGVLSPVQEEEDEDDGDLRRNGGEVELSKWGPARSHWEEDGESTSRPYSDNYGMGAGGRAQPEATTTSPRGNDDGNLLGKDSTDEDFLAPGNGKPVAGDGHGHGQEGGASQQTNGNANGGHLRGSSTPSSGSDPGGTHDASGRGTNGLPTSQNHATDGML